MELEALVAQEVLVPQEPLVVLVVLEAPVALAVLEVRSPRSIT